MSAIIGFTIPAPTVWLNANDRQHFMPRNTAVQAWRWAANMQVGMARPWDMFDGPVSVIATVHKSRAGRWDAHNLFPTLKACIDGLVDAGLIPDDSNEHVTFVGIRAGEKRAQACLVLEVVAE